MKKIIFLFLCCGLIIGMVGCGSNTAPPPSETVTTASETVITDTPTKTTSPQVTVEPTEKEKEHISTESKATATKPTTTATTPTTTAKPKEESKLPATTSSAAKNNTEYQPTWEDINVYGYMVDIPEDQLDDAPKEEIIIPPKPDAKVVAERIVEYINQYRTEQGAATATILPGLTEYCELRAVQLITNFAHDTTDQRSAAAELQYGRYVDWSEYGIEGEGYDNYYTAECREAIGKGNWGGTADEIAKTVATGFRNSANHWRYVGDGKYTYIGVGIIYHTASCKWYCCVCVSDINHG